MRELIAAPLPEPEYAHHQSPVIRADGLIFRSGMVAIHPETGEREHGTVTTRFGK